MPWRLCVCKVILILILISSCSKQEDDLGFRTYVIPEGEHSSGNYFNHPTNSRIDFHFMLDESAIYTTEIPENQHDVNKIYGFSDFGVRHQKYSIRLGWRYLNNELELCWLRHEEGRHTAATIRTIDGDTTMVRRRPEGNWGLIKRYYLYPYFGGNEYAPHDITIKIKE